TAEQVPSLPARPHDWQSPAQVEPQQKPCAQIIELQSVFTVQACPFGRPTPQVVPVHTLGAAQSAAEVAGVHEVLHAPPLSHWYGSQLTEVAAWQTPAPSQVRWDVRVDPVQA